MLGWVIVLSAIGTGIASVGLVWYLNRHRGSGGASWFMAALTAQAVWVFSYGGGLLLTDPGLRAHAEALAWIGMNWVGPLFLGFTLEYTGRSGVARSRWFPAVFLAPVATTLLGLTHAVHGLLWTDFRIEPVFGLATARYTIEPSGYALVMISLVMAGAGVLMLVETVVSYGPLYRREAVAVALSPIPATVPLLVWLGQIGPWPALNLTPSLLLTHVALDAYAFVGTQMFETNPTTQRAARQSALNDLEDPLFVVDTNDQVVNLNERAKELFETAYDAMPSTVAALTGTGLDELRTSGEYTTVGPQPRVYAVSYTPLTDPSGEGIGGIVVLYDITDERRQKQQLSVLNRVFRHNLRNEITVIQGHAESISERATDTQRSSQAETISESSDRLLSIAEKIREFEQIRNQDVRIEAIDVARFVDEIRRTVGEAYPDARIGIEVDDTITSLHSDPAVLSLALSNLVENALDHGERSETRVQIRASSDGSVTTFEIRDDNPRIPEIEVESLGERTETPLQHGRGIGLSVVNWCMTALGGDLGFEYDNGNVVTISLPTHTRHES